MKRMLALVLALVMVIGMMPAIAVNAQTTDRVADLVANMSLRDKVTQMMMVDFRKWGATSASATDFTEMNDEVRKIIEDYNFGSIILFANNIKETSQSYNLVYAMQEAATKDDGIALIICADQEGGSVYRLGSGTALPGNMALGATYANNGTKYALHAGQIIGSELDAVGINGNLAPVVDVNNNANNPVIGLRSYSDDATIVGELASASIAGMAEYNVIGTAKHFPGHGDTATDSHYGLPIVDKSLDVLKEVELKPYEVAIDQGIEMIMTAHILYPQLESDKIYSNKSKAEESLPATMSDDILTGLLKEDMGFEGIIVTDAMNMAGISGKWDQVQSCVIAIQSGVDLICMPCTLNGTASLANLDTIINGIIAAVEDGTIPMERIDDANRRILTVKENRGILDYDASEHTLEKANAVVGCKANRDMERELAAAAVTVVKNDGSLPLNLTATSKVLMMVPYNNERAQMLMAWNRAKAVGLIPEGAEVDYVTFSKTSTIESLQTKLDWADTIIINSEISATSRYNPSGSTYWLYNIPNQICDYAAANGKKAIISSVDKPYDVQMYANANAIVAAYGCKGSSVDPTEALIGGATGSAAAYGPNIIAAVEVILGTFEAQGKLPVNIPVYDWENNTYSTENAYERGHGLTYEAKAPEHHVWNGLECENCGATREYPFSDIPESAFYYDAALWAMDNGYTAGKDDGTFGAADDLKRCQVVTMLWSAAGKPIVEIDNPFTDVKESDWFYNAVLWAYDKGITSGVTESKFDPAGTTNRAQAVTFLWASLDKPAAEGTYSFSDVPAGAWCAPAINWAVENNVTSGIGDNAFGPLVTCKRAHMVTFLYAALAE